MEAIIEALKGTPWWVYILFFYLVYIGIKAMKTQVVSLKTVFILPVLFLVWGLYNLIERKELIAILEISTLTITFIIGIVIGSLLMATKEIQADKKKHLLTFPGGPLTLILILLIFATKYYFSYMYALDPTAFKDRDFVLTDLSSSGIITGVFVGRALCLLRKYKKAPHSEL